MFFHVVDRAADGVSGPIKRFLEWRPLVYVGVTSYGIYVYHDVLPLLDRVLLGGAVWRALLPESYGWRPALVVFVASCAVASASWHLFEEPLNRLKSRFPYLPPAPGRDGPGSTGAQNDARAQSLRGG
jgi:peptidoglycan/LPS O-acetylase OafA/YrhL